MVKYCCTFLCSDLLVSSWFILFYPAKLLPSSYWPNLLEPFTSLPPPSLLLVLSPRPTVSCSRTFYPFPASLLLASTPPLPLSYWSDTESPNLFPVTCLPQPPHFPSKKSLIAAADFEQSTSIPSLPSYQRHCVAHTHTPSYQFRTVKNSEQFSSGW